MRERFIIGVTGASGSIYSRNLIEKMSKMDVDLHLIISEKGEEVFEFETGTSFASFVEKLQSENGGAAIVLENNCDMFSKVASGSFNVDAMVILPCSMKTLSALSNGYSASLLERAADVMLKEKKTLIVAPRESPVSSIHLRNMLRLSESGAVIMPASPGFYTHPETIDDLADFITGKILNSLSIEHDLGTEWKGR